jgi:hypothetical protein
VSWYRKQPVTKPLLELRGIPGSDGSAKEIVVLLTVGKKHLKKGSEKWGYVCPGVTAIIYPCGNTKEQKQVNWSAFRLHIKTNAILIRKALSIEHLYNS